MGQLTITAELSAGLEAHGLFLAEGVVLSLPFRFETPVRLWPFVQMHGSSVGAYSYVAFGVQLSSVNIGRYCSIGDGFNVLSHHPSDWLTAHPFSHQHIFPAPFRSAAIDAVSPVETTRIGNDVWIGSRVSLKGGVTVGDGALIGAGAVVTKDVPPFSVMGGVPARVIRRRFSDALIERIQACPWWDWDLRELALDWRHPEAAQATLEASVAESRVQRWTPGWRLLDFGTPTSEGAPAPLVLLPG
jgi:acetyltransferase-like isoleucine patch superfamily enzyme